MSRQLAKDPGRRLAVFRPLAGPRGLAHEVVQRLSAEITGGKLQPGSRLPTEQEMIAAFGVSRTVIREAVAALRAEGLVVTRQGIGTIVADGTGRPFRLDIDHRRSLNEILNVAELRTGVEIEAAGLAAERAGAEAKRRIDDSFKAIERAIVRGEDAVDEDFAFHCSIAEATGNPQFRRFLDFLGRFIIPRQMIRSEATNESRPVYLRRIQKEHADICDAIRAQKVSDARAAMRRHLLNSRKRYKQLSEKIGRT